MKRFYIAIALLLAASSLCAYEMTTVKTIANKYCDILDEIVSKKDFGEITEAEVLSLSMLKDWDKSSKELNKFVYHDYIGNITVALSEIPLYIKNASNDETESYINGIKIQLASLNESELPYIHNIL